MITVRTAGGNLKCLWTIPPLRLRPRTNYSRDDNDDDGAMTPSTLFATMPEEVIRRILSFLTIMSRDWIAADSTCRTWWHATLPLWGGIVPRKNIIRYLSARDRMRKAWRTVESFVDRDVRSSLNGPASEGDVALLAAAIRPWTLPHDLAASVRIHDGEWHRGHGRGMVAGARLLTTREMVEEMRRWRGMPTAACDYSDDSARASGVLKVPLFSATGAFQIAMELRQRTYDSDDSRGSLSVEGREGEMHGRIVVVSPSAPYAVHYRVEASCWERFLTLI